VYTNYYSASNIASMKRTNILAAGPDDENQQI